MTIWRMHIVYWIPKPTNTHSEYVVMISVILQQWWHERASMLHYTYIACLILYFDIPAGRKNVAYLDTTKVLFNFMNFY
jgi:hypothetical protein